MPTSSTVPTGKSLSISTVYRRYSRQYNSAVNFDDLQREPLCGSWVLNLIARLAARSHVRAYGHVEMMLFKRGLNHALSIELARPILLANAACVTRHDISRLFELVQRAEPSSFHGSKKHRERASAAFRQRVLEYGKENEFDGPVSRETVVFRAHSSRSRPRPIVSDLIGLVGGPLGRVPIDAISHSTVRDLERKARDRIFLDLERIIDACIADLTFWAGIRADLNSLSECVISEFEVVNRAFDLAVLNGKHVSGWVRKALCGLRPVELIGGYVKRAKSYGLAHIDAAGTYTFIGAVPALRSIYGAPGKFKTNQGYKAIFLPERMHPEELMAAFVLLMIYTGWNMHSLVAMTSDRIHRSREAYEIQGFKSKTDDDTPSIFIDKTHRFGIEVLDLLLWNLAGLMKLGRVGHLRRGYGFVTLVPNFLNIKNNISDFSERFMIFVISMVFHAFHLSKFVRR